VIDTFPFTWTSQDGETTVKIDTFLDGWSFESSASDCKLRFVYKPCPDIFLYLSEGVSGAKQNGLCY
jgi:hypothetical protein